MLNTYIFLAVLMFTWVAFYIFLKVFKIVATMKSLIIVMMIDQASIAEKAREEAEVEWKRIVKEKRGGESHGRI